MFLRHFTSKVSVLPFGVAVFCALTLGAAPAKAAFHLWQIQEIYSDASGTLQFIELFDPFGGQNFIGNQQISVSNIGNTKTNTFTVPNITLAGTTGNHHLLFATAGVQAAGGPTPDFVIPSNFLFAAGGKITFFGSNSGNYSAIPTDGSHSQLWAAGTQINNPQNFAGQSGTIVPAIVPEPATFTLMSLCVGVLGASRIISRRRAARATNGASVSTVSSE